VSNVDNSIKTVDNAIFFEPFDRLTGYKKIKRCLIASFLNKKVPAQGYKDRH
jgi:hypothetical protein